MTSLVWANTADEALLTQFCNLLSYCSSAYPQFIGNLLRSN